VISILILILILSFDPREAHSAVAMLNLCLLSIRHWMAANFLKLNDVTTELLLVGHPKHLAKVTNFELLLGDVQVRPSHAARSLCVHFYHSLSFYIFIQKAAATAVYHIPS